jgi:hypothetical protein
VYHREREFYCGNGEIAKAYDKAARKRERAVFETLLQSTVISLNFTVDGKMF